MNNLVSFVTTTLNFARLLYKEKLKGFSDNCGTHFTSFLLGILDEIRKKRAAPADEPALLRRGRPRPSMQHQLDYGVLKKVT